MKTDATTTFTWKAMLRRAGTHMWLKAAGTTVIMAAFFVGYFTVLRDPAFPPVTVPLTWLDGLVGFMPWTLAAYFSLWVYVSLPASLMTDRRELFSYGAGSALLGAAGLAIFWRWPTTLAPVAVDWSLYPAFEFLKSADAAGNACPSLHVAFAVFSCLWFVRMLPALGAGRFARAVNLLWAALIVHSTLGTHQHVALDALFGALLGALAAGLNFIVTPQRDSSGGEQRALWTAVAVIKVAAVLLWTSGVPLVWALPLFVSGGALVLYHLFAPNAQGLVRVFSTFTSDAREVWLTIDDGPDPEDTPRLLDALEREGAKATFFLVGQRAARHPELVAAIMRRGHEIAHHTHTHPCADFWCATPGRVRRELDGPAALLAAKRFRCPVGIKPLELGRALRARGLACIGWSVRSGDSFATTPETVAARVLGTVCPGAIILMHEGPPVQPAVRVEAVRQVLAGLSAHGYRCIIPRPEQLR